MQRKEKKKKWCEARVRRLQSAKTHSGQETVPSGARPKTRPVRLPPSIPSFAPDMSPAGPLQLLASAAWVTPTIQLGMALTLVNEHWRAFGPFRQSLACDRGTIFARGTSSSASFATEYRTSIRERLRERS